MEGREIICVGCPLGCHVVLIITESGEIAGFEGNECKAGKAYVTEEFKSPVRVFTGTIRTRNCSRPLLPVRTNKPIIKTMMLSCGKCLSDMEINPPIRIGDVIISNILNTGTDLIASGDLDK